MSLENPRRVLELRRDRGGMQQRANARAAKFLRPEFAQMIEWKFDGHSVLLAQRGILARRCSGACVKHRQPSGVRRGECLYNFLRNANAARVAIALRTAHNLANNSPWRV